MNDDPETHPSTTYGPQYGPQNGPQHNSGPWRGRGNQPTSLPLASPMWAIKPLYVKICAADMYS